MQEMKQDNHLAVVTDIDNEAISAAIHECIANAAERGFTKSEISCALHSLVNIIIYEYEIETL